MQPALVTYLESIEDIRRINKSEVTANTLSGINALIAYVSLGIIAILFAVSIFLISNTVTIGISVRKEEINIMKYIGATDFFVRSPFVIEGMLIGLIGSLLPLGIIYFIYNNVILYVTERFEMLTKLLDFFAGGGYFSDFASGIHRNGRRYRFYREYSDSKEALKGLEILEERHAHETMEEGLVCFFMYSDCCLSGRRRDGRSDGCQCIRADK